MEKNDSMSLRAMLDRVTEICNELQITNLSSQIQSCRSLINGGNEVDVAVFGRFKAGKSSFLNILSGDSILPVGVIPVTSVITRLKYGEQKKISVHFENGQVEEIAVEQLADYVSEELNPENIKRVNIVEIELPALENFKGIRFVDTPGLGSVFKHNTESALDWLPKVGVALVAISVDPPLSEQDLNLIRELRRFTPNIVIVLTKADLQTPIQLEQIIGFIHKELLGQLGQDFSVYPISVLATHISFKDIFTKSVLLSLTSEIDLKVKELLKYKFHNLLHECEGLLRVAKASSVKSKLEREQLQEKILGEKLGLLQTREELKSILRDIQENARSEYVEKLNKYQQKVLDSLLLDLQLQFSQWRFNLWDFSRAFEKWLSEALTKIMVEIAIEEYAMFLEPLKRAELRFYRVIKAFHARLSRNIEEQLGVEIKATEFKPKVDIPKCPDISVGYTFDFHIDLLWFLIPMCIFRKFFQRYFISKLPYEVEKNLSRLASQWGEIINSAVRNIEKQVERRILEEINTFEQLILRAENSSRRLETFSVDISEFQKENMN